MKDIKGNEIKEGYLLLNLQDERAPFDAWALLICITDQWNGQVIRDLNAWNVGWDPKETFILGHFSKWKNILEDDYEHLIKAFNLHKE